MSVLVQNGMNLMQIGAYAHGTDPLLDEAIALQPPMHQFLQQDMFEASSMDEALQGMAVCTSLTQAGL